MAIDSIGDLGKLASLDPGLLKDISPELVSRISDLVFVVKAAGILDSWGLKITRKEDNTIGSLS